MPLLDANGPKAEAFTRAEPDAALPAGDVILPLERLAQEGPAVLARGDRLGVLVPNTVRPDDLAPWLARLSLVAVAFPSFSDGRGFSVAKILRRAANEAGRPDLVLRADGPLIADEYAYALACGFDEIAVPEALWARQGAAQWTAAKTSVSMRYQGGYRGGPTILEQRRAAREGAGAR